MNIVKNFFGETIIFYGGIPIYYIDNLLKISVMCMTDKHIGDKELIELTKISNYVQLGKHGEIL